MSRKNKIAPERSGAVQRCQLGVHFVAFLLRLGHFALGDLFRIFQRLVFGPHLPGGRLQVPGPVLDLYPARFVLRRIGGTL